MVPDVARQAKRHLKWLMGFGAAGLVATGAINLAVNPWRVLPEKTEVKSLDAYREVDAEIRTSKGGLAMRGPWDVLIIGSSRPNSGIDPLGASFQGRKAVNLGMSGCDLYETKAMLEFALRHQKPQRVLLFLDAGDLTRLGKIPISTDFEISPLANGDATERELRYIFSQRSLGASFGVVKMAADDSLSKRQSPQWLHRHYQKKPFRGPIFTPLGLQVRDVKPVDYYNTLENFYLPWALVLTDSQKRQLGIQKDKLTVLREMLETCAAHGVDAVLAMPPNHLTIVQVMEEAGAPDPYYLAERRVIAETVAEVNQRHPHHPCQYWDLNIPSEITREGFPARETPGLMTYWFDQIHFNTVAGEIYNDQMMGVKPEDSTLALHVDVTQSAEYVARVESLFKAAAGDLPDQRAGIQRVLKTKNAP